MNELEKLAKEYSHSVVSDDQFDEETDAISIFSSIESDFIEGFYAAAHMFLDWISTFDSSKCYASILAKYENFIEDEEITLEEN